MRIFSLRYIWIFLLVLFTKEAFSQSIINDSIINDYKKVIYINTDTAQVDDASGISIGDKVMIIQMTGATLNPLDQFVISNLFNTGKFEILKVKTIVSNKIVFTADIENNYNVSEAVQLIPLPEYDQVVFNSTLKAKKWDGEKGGILAFIANQSITLNADIDVSGLGFRGADPKDEPDYLGECSNESIIYQRFDYHDSVLHRAGLKGEGFISKSSMMTKGRGANGNGGGGGNGPYSGGGGGNNIVFGGRGGYELKTCDNSISSYYGIGGGFEEAGSFYNTQETFRRITMGGGGGTSTQNKSLGYVATKGGDGGGIVFIIADSLIGNGHRIKANGMQPEGLATAGAGGGGGGGAILLGIDNYVDQDLILEANGGNGGWTVMHDLDSLTGPGGGGGKGVIWHVNSSIPSAVSDSAKVLYGKAGENGILNPQNKFWGASPGFASIDGLEDVNPGMIPPLTGFLFNYISNDQMICEGETPIPLKGTRPKGGSGTYIFQWQSRSNVSGWSNVGTVADSLVYAPGPLTDTTYFRRVVTSGGINDTSKQITIIVHDKIVGNDIGDNEQLICAGQVPSVLTGSGYTGGDNVNFDYQWEISLDGSNFADASGTNTLETYDPGVLLDSSLYRRKIMSGVCESYSDTVLVNVLHAIAGNDISEDQDVCYNDTPELLTGPKPTGGEEGVYRYTWQQSADAVSWGNATGTIDYINYSPGNLTDTIYYRRYVVSGSADLCNSYSDTVEIIVLDPIANNIIPAKDTSCQDDNIMIIGSVHTKGDINNYRYEWISSLNNTVWTSESGSDVKDYTKTDLVQDIFFKRIVYSGRNDACVDTSGRIDVRVWNRINGNTIGSDQELCFGSQPLDLTGNSGLTGGNGNYDFEWQIREESENYAGLTGNNKQNGYAFDYVPEVNNYFIRRKVTSHVCTNYSDSIALVVLPVIENNLISAVDSVCYNNPANEFDANELSGGTGSFGYKWEKSDDGSVFGSAAPGDNIEKYAFSGLTDKTYFRRIVTSGSCSDTSNVEAIAIMPLPTSNILTLSDSLCNGDSLIINLSLTGESPWSLTFLDENQQSQVVSIASPNQYAVLRPAANFQFSVSELRDNNNCVATENTGFSDIYIFDYPDVDGGGQDLEVCGLETTLDGISGYDSYWENISSEVDFDNANKPDALATSSSYGEMSVVYHMLNWQCATNDTVHLAFYEQPENIYGGEDFILYIRPDTMLDADPPIVGYGIWESMDTSETIIIEEPDNPKTIIDNLNKKEGVYTFVWKITNGVCDALTDTLHITKKYLGIPSGFSPNNDGVNDFFIILGVLESAGNRKMEMRIINNWGQEVYYSDDYRNDWDGTNKNGEELPEGTYFYIFKYNGNETGGYINLRR